MVKGGERGNVMAGEDYQKSLLWRAINYHEADLQMPPSGKMPEETIAAFREWMTTGAVDPRKEATAMAKEDAKESMESKTAKHWAYQPPVAPALPEVKAKIGYETISIDSFLPNWSMQSCLQIQKPIEGR